ncbi:MAG: ATP-binding protein [Dehalococcoidia bacterium]
MQNLQQILDKLKESNPSLDPLNRTSAEIKPVVFECDECLDKGWLTSTVPIWHENFGDLIVCPSCKKSNQNPDIIKKRIEFSNLVEMSHLTFEKINTSGNLEGEDNVKKFREALKVSKKYAQNPSGWLTIQGPNGSGKTYLAAAVGNQCIQNGNSVLFMFFPDLLDRFRSAFQNTDSFIYDDFIDQVRNYPILILDGISTSNNTPWASEKILQILNHRNLKNLPTVITTSENIYNLDPYLQSRLNSSETNELITTGNLKTPYFSRFNNFGQTPKSYQDLSFKNFNIYGARGSAAPQSDVSNLTAALKAAEEFVSLPKNTWLCFWSDKTTGVGKTHLAAAISNELIKQNIQVLFFRTSDLMDYIRKSYDSRNNLNGDTIFEEIKESQILILDDLGRGTQSEWANEKLYQLIAYRHDNRLSTIFTSRDNIPEEAEKGSATDSRIADPAIGICIEITAPNYRH